MRLLLDYGADVNARRRDGKTPLHCASFNGIFETVKLLLERGANVDIRNRDGQTPMQIAIQQGHRRIIELLREREQGVTIQVRFIHPFDFYRRRITDTFPLPRHPRSDHTIWHVQSMIPLQSLGITSQGIPTPYESASHP
jgi:ankyrin repeat protein